MKSIMKRSLALLTVVAMLLSMLAVPALAVNSNSHVDSHATELDNEPCVHVKNGTATAEQIGDRVPATCMTAGGDWMQCTNRECKDVWLANPTPIDPEAHVYEDTVVPPSCWSEGYTAKVCKYNPQHKIEKAEPKDPLGPNYQPDPNHVSDGGNCVTNGAFYWVCANENCDCEPLCDADAATPVNCVDANNDGKVDRTEHKCKAWVDDDYVADGHNIVVVEPDECAVDANDKLIYKAPTCTVAGMITFKCEACTDVEPWNVTVAAYGHDLRNVTYRGATCIATGLKAGQYCDRPVDENQDGHDDVDADGNVIRCSHTVDAYDATKRGEAAFVTPIVEHNPVDLTGKIRLVEVEGKLYLTDDTTVEEIDAYYGGKCAPAGGTPELGYQYQRCDKGCGEVTLVESVAPAHVPYTGTTVVDDPLKVAPVEVPNSCTEWGYTWYTCSVCGENGQNEDVKGLRDHRIAPEHTYVAAGSSFKVVYTYKEVDADGNTVLKDGKPVYMINASTDVYYYSYTVETHAGYKAVEWAEYVAPTCGEKATFVHTCLKCTDGLESLEFMLEHLMIAGSETFHPATCTADAYYTARCSRTGCEGNKAEGYRMDYTFTVEQGPADGPINGTSTETASYKALGHQKPDGTRSPYGYHVGAAASTCTAAGNKSFDACFDPTCPDATLKANRAYLNDDGTVNKTAIAGTELDDAADGHKWDGEKGMDPTCNNPSYKIVVCSVCDAEQWDELDSANSAWEARISGSEAHDGRQATGQHNYVFAVAGKESTCVENGYEELWTCENCGLASNVEGQRGDGYALDVDDIDLAQKRFEPTCSAPGYVFTYCAECVKDGLLVPGTDSEGRDVYVVASGKTVPAGHEWAELSTFDKPNGDLHEIASTNIIYLVDDEGNRVVRNGRYVIVSFVKEADGTVYLMDGASKITPAAGDQTKVKNGTCQEDGDDLHQNYYTCKHCNEVILFSVRLEHTYDDSKLPTCETSVNCTVPDCNKVIKPTVGHDWHQEGTANAACGPVNPVNGYEIWKCSYADCTYTDAEDATAVADARCNTNAVGYDYRFTEALVAPAHTYDPNDNPTCLNDVVCDVCRDTIKEAKGEHTWSDWTPVAPTCELGGYKYRVCSGENCDIADKTEKVDTDPKLGHDFGKKQYNLSRTADCYVFGYTIAFCYNCHLEVKFDSKTYAPDKGHTIATFTQAPTCEAPGKTVEYCSECNKTIDENKTDLDWANVPAYKNVTSTTEGMEQLAHKNEFGDVLLNDCTEIDKLLAKYAEEIEADDTYKDRVLKCVVPNGCNYTYTDADGHVWAVGKQEQTCTQQGIDFKYCENCEEKIIVSVKAPLGHGHNGADSLQWVIDSHATCTTAGAKHRVCLDCATMVGTELVPTVIKVDDPMYVSGDITSEIPVVTRPATAEDVTETPAATGHTATKWTVDVPASCTENGHMYLECTVCDAAVKVDETFFVNGQPVVATAENIVDTITKLGHEFTVVVPGTYKAPTIYANGEYTANCVRHSECGQSYVHTYQDDCEDTEHEDLKKLEGVLLSAEIVNANGKEALITNKSTIAYTLYIESDGKNVDMLQLQLSFNTSVFSYANRFELPQIDENTKGNIFGTTIGAGSASTFVNATEDGKVNIFIDNSTGKVVTVGEKTALVTIYFEVNADAIAQYADGFDCAITIKDSASDTTGQVLVVPADEEVLSVYANNEDTTVEINKLGDLNGDGYINAVDLKLMKSITPDAGYDARADIDQDGVVTSFDKLAILDYILSNDYAAFLAYAGAETYTA